MRWSLFLAGWILVAGMATHATAEPKVSEYAGHGKWHDIATTAPAGQPVPNPVLDQVERLLDAHRDDDAHEILTPWMEAHPDATDRDRAVFLLADVYYQSGSRDRFKSFYFLDELMDKYPESRFFGLALQKQYQIADAYLNGYKNRFLGLRILTAEDEAIEMLYRIQERAPGSALAERSLLRTADYYFRSSQFELAADAYASYLRSYPRSAEVPYVKLRAAFSSLAQFRGSRYDATPLIDARSQFLELIDKYPALAAEENVQERIQRIDDTLAHKLYYTADFYRRTSHPGAAVYVYRSLIETYPNSRDAQAAQLALKKMPRSALDQPPAARSAPPTTQPTSRPASGVFGP